MKTIFRSWGLVVLLAELGQVTAEGSSPSPADLKALQAKGKFHEVHALKELPKPVLDLFVGKGEVIADPGQKWEAGCTRPAEMPARHLIWAVTDGDYYVVHLERGGRAHSFECFAARLKPGEGKAVVVWGNPGVQMKNFSNFLDVFVHSRLGTGFPEKNGSTSP